MGHSHFHWVPQGCGPSGKQIALIDRKNCAKNSAKQPKQPLRQNLKHYSTVLLFKVWVSVSSLKFTKTPVFGLVAEADFPSTSPPPNSAFPTYSLL